jgi:hypothetical protein
VIAYRRIIDLFLNYLGARSDRALTTMQPRQVEDFKTHLGKRVSPSTVNKGVKVLKAALNAASWNSTPPNTSSLSKRNIKAAVRSLARNCPRFCPMLAQSGAQ